MKITIIDTQSNTVVKSFTPIVDITLKYTHINGMLIWDPVVIETTEDNQIASLTGIYEIKAEGILLCVLKGFFVRMDLFGKNDGKIYLNYLFQPSSVSTQVFTTVSASAVSPADAYDRAMSIVGR